MWACIFTCLAFRQTVKSQSEMSAIWILMWSHHFPNRKVSALEFENRMDMWTAKWAHWNLKTGWSCMSSKCIFACLAYGLSNRRVGAHWNWKTGWSYMSSSCMFACLAYGQTVKSHSGSALELNTHDGDVWSAMWAHWNSKRRMDMWATKWAHWKDYTALRQHAHTHYRI